MFHFGKTYQIIRFSVKMLRFLLAHKKIIISQKWQAQQRSFVN